MRLVVLPGDGIGPEITAATMQVLRRADALFSLGLAFEEHEIGLARLAREGSTLPESVIEAARAADGIVLGPVDSYAYPPRDKGGINVSGEMRIRFDLYANIRPSRSRPGLPHYGRTPMDVVIVRENTEGFYADRNMHLGIGEFMPTPDLALSVRKISAEGSARIARAAFELAMRRKRRKVTAVHKHNVLKVTEGLFLREVRRIAEQFPDVAYDEQLVDSMAALLVRDAQRYDVVVTTNMYGDILSDEASELSGSLGLAGSINHSDTHGMAQAQHGSAPDIAGQDKANPVSLILSAAMLLDWHARRGDGRENFARAAAAIEQVADALIADPARRTADLGGRLGTRAFAEAFCAALTA
ncbi:MAG TPA: isocitrate/isopropylmalate dehydrogenase family protein [Falsiroseomonas sp.]|jgi:3-isopropylmalate dehydrogenase|nr:isocitrate/isopropylmalate dehydrogenase family protein [Falsiroseomonas sp.]